MLTIETDLAISESGAWNDDRLKGTILRGKQGSGHPLQGVKDHAIPPLLSCFRDPLKQVLTVVLAGGSSRKEHAGIEKRSNIC
jgi:hypothetical protein